MPILRPHVAHMSSVMFTSAHLYGNVYMRVSVARTLSDLSDFGLLMEQSSQKFVIPCLGRRWTAVQNVTPLALSSAEKSITVQTHTHIHKKTVNDISTACLSACMDNNRANVVLYILFAYWSTLMVCCRRRLLLKPVVVVQTPTSLSGRQRTPSKSPVPVRQPKTFVTLLRWVLTAANLPNWVEFRLVTSQ